MTRAADHLRTTRRDVFEDLIADFVIEEGREPDLEEMAWLARSIRRFFGRESIA